MKTLRIAAALLLLALLPGCLATDRDVAESVRIGSHWGAVALFDDQARVLTPAERATVARQNLNVLALSGGGADGAFGAGFMTGWTEAGTRPAFDIVTGVSTGALMATFVFIGSSADAALTDLYTNTRTQDVYSTRGMEGLLGDSLHDTTPLKARIARLITPDTLAMVAAAHAAGRRLYIATTNLDAGTVTVWNMGEIAASNHPDRLALYREVLRASAAVPGFFAPVMIPATSGQPGAQMHVDGGVKAPILLRSFMLNGPYKTKTIYLLVNGALTLRAAEKAVPSSLAGIAKKSITELLRGLLYKTIYQAYVTVQQSGAGFNLTYIPDDVAPTRDPLEFNPAEMRRLYDAGRRLALSGQAWHHEPPRLEALERVGAPRRPRHRPVRPAPRPAARAAAQPAG